MRLIDADALMAQLVRKKAPVAAIRYTDGFNDALMRFRSMIHSASSVMPTPDPITGLVPCGCGGKARIKHDGSYSSKRIVKNADETVRYENATVVYPGHTHAWVDCDNNKCECSVGYSGGLIFRTDEEARDAWNVAMGYTAPPRPGAIGPETGEMAPNGGGVGE